MRHHTQLIFVFLVESGFHYVDQSGLDLLPGDPPALASQSAGITGMSHCPHPHLSFWEAEAGCCGLRAPDVYYFLFFSR